MGGLLQVIDSFSFKPLLLGSFLFKPTAFRLGPTAFRLGPTAFRLGLIAFTPRPATFRPTPKPATRDARDARATKPRAKKSCPKKQLRAKKPRAKKPWAQKVTMPCHAHKKTPAPRTDERSVGKECVRTWRNRWS